MEMLISLHNAVPKAVGAFCQEFWLKDGNEVKIQQNFSINKSKHTLWGFFSLVMVRGLGMKLFPALLQNLYLTICFCRNRKASDKFSKEKIQSSSVSIKTFGFILIK